METTGAGKLHRDKIKGEGKNNNRALRTTSIYGAGRRGESNGD